MYIVNMRWYILSKACHDLNEDIEINRSLGVVIEWEYPMKWLLSVYISLSLSGVTFVLCFLCFPQLSKGWE